MSQIFKCDIPGCKNQDVPPHNSSANVKIFFKAEKAVEKWADLCPQHAEGLWKAVDAYFGSFPPIDWTGGGFH